MDVKMQVLCGLVIAAVARETATAMLLGDTATKFGREAEHLMDDRQIAGIQCRQRSDVAFGDDDDVNGPVWLGVVKGENLFGLGNAPDGNMS